MGNNAKTQLAAAVSQRYLPTENLVVAGLIHSLHACQADPSGVLAADSSCTRSAVVEKGDYCDTICKSVRSPR